MCDALSRNVPRLAAGTEILLANCLAHGRRQFVDVAENFPSECRYVLEMLGQVYGHDAEAREHGLTPDQRLRLHQQHSTPIMDELHHWLESQLAERRTEPNSGLGQAIGYLLRHWQPLTLFLRQAGAPLDNNIVERALKRAGSTSAALPSVVSLIGEPSHEQHANRVPQNLDRPMLGN